jgi:hypothetical protein
LPPDSAIVTVFQKHALLFSLGPGMLAMVILLRQRHHARAIGWLLLCLSLASLNATSGPRTWGHRGEVDDPAFQRSALLSIVDSVHTVQELDPKGNLFFWYDGEARLGHLYRSVASTYLWSYRLQSEDFPRLGPKLPPVDRRVLILAEDGDSALRQAEISLAGNGLSAEFLTRRTIHQGPFRWEMIEIQVKTKTAGPAKPS